MYPKISFNQLQCGHMMFVDVKGLSVKEIRQALEAEYRFPSYDEIIATIDEYEASGEHFLYALVGSLDGVGDDGSGFEYFYALALEPREKIVGNYNDNSLWNIAVVKK